MPFARIPESGSLQLPASPDFTRAGNLATELIARRPIVDYAGIVDKAVGQISNILTYNSPQAKLQRQIQQYGLQQEYNTWQGWKNNPDDYVMTSHGPIPKNGLEALTAMGHLKLLNAEAAAAQHRAQPTSVPDFGSLNSRASQLKGGTPEGTANAIAGNVNQTVPADKLAPYPVPTPLSGAGYSEGASQSDSSDAGIPTNIDGQPLYNLDGTPGNPKM